MLDHQVCEISFKSIRLQICITSGRLIVMPLLAIALLIDKNIAGSRMSGHHRNNNDVDSTERESSLKI